MTAATTGGGAGAAESDDGWHGHRPGAEAMPGPRLRTPGRVRVSTDRETFERWLAEHPLAPQGTTSLPPGEPFTMPPAVAAAVSTHVGAEVTIAARVWAPAGGVLAFAAVAGDLGSVIVRRYPPGELEALGSGDPAPLRFWDHAGGTDAADAVEVSLLPARELVEELVRVLPVVPPRVEDVTSAGVHLAVAAADEPAAAWEETWVAGAPHWRRLLPSDTDEDLYLDPDPRTRSRAAADLRPVVAAALQRLWATTAPVTDPWLDRTGTPWPP